MGRGHFICQAITSSYSKHGAVVRLAQYIVYSHCVTNSVEMRCMLQCLCEHSTADLTAANKGWQGYP